MVYIYILMTLSYP